MRCQWHLILIHQPFRTPDLRKRDFTALPFDNTIHNIRFPRETAQNNSRIHLYIFRNDHALLAHTYSLCAKVFEVGVMQIYVCNDSPDSVAEAEYFLVGKMKARPE